MIIRSPIVSERKAMKDMAHSGLSSFLGAFLGIGRRDYSRVLDDPTGSSLIMAVILWIVRRWPEAPLYLEKVSAKAGAKGDAVYSHPMLSLLESPNPSYSGAMLWWGWILSLVWDGNGYAAKIRNGRTLEPEQLWYIPHFLIRPMVRDGSASFIDYYEYTPGGAARIELDPSDVIHLRYGIDPYNPRKGMSPLKSIARDAATDEEADSFAAAMLRNMGVPGLLVSPDVSGGQMPQGFDVDEVKRYIKDRFSGDRRGEPMVNKGPTKIQQFGFDPKSMDLSTLRGIPEERVSAVTGIPAAVVGFGSGLAQTKVGATMKELREMAYEDGIIPLQRLVGPELQTQLLDEFEPNPEGWKVCFDLSKVRVLQDDQDALYKRTIEAWNGGVINRAQAKQAIGFEALPTDGIRRVPFAVEEIEDGQPLAVEPPAATDPAAGNPVPSKGRKARKGIGRRERRFAAIQMRAGARHQAAYALELADGFSALAARVVKAYEATDLQLRGRDPGGLKADPIEPIDPDSPEGLAITTEAHRILQFAQAAGPLSDELAWKQHYMAVSSTTMDNVEAIFGVKIDLPDLVQREVVARGGKHIALVDIDRQTQDAIFKALAQGRSAGMGPEAIARIIRSQVEGAAMYPGVYQEAHDRAIARGWSEEKAAGAGDRAARQYRSEVISRTETKFAQNISTIEVGKNSDTFDAMLCFDAQLGPTDEECEALNGQTVSFEEAEQLAQDEHPNGTRSFTPTISGGD